eukprot:4631248-Prymnesium_polylepis.3
MLDTHEHSIAQAVQASHAGDAHTTTQDAVIVAPVDARQKRRVLAKSLSEHVSELVGTNAARVEGCAIGIDHLGQMNVFVQRVGLAATRVLDRDKFEPFKLNLDLLERRSLAVRSEEADAIIIVTFEALDQLFDVWEQLDTCIVQIQPKQRLRNFLSAAQLLADLMECVRITYVVHRLKVTRPQKVGANRVCHRLYPVERSSPLLLAHLGTGEHQLWARDLQIQRSLYIFVIFVKSFHDLAREIVNALNIVNEQLLPLPFHHFVVLRLEQVGLCQPVSTDLR